MQQLGKTLVIAGAVLVVVGLILWKTGGLGGLGRLPGDIRIEKPNVSFYFPLTTCIILSIVLTLIMWLFRR